MNRKEYKQLTEEMIPVINQLSEVLKKYVSDEKDCSVIVKGDGYFHIMIRGITYTASRKTNDSNMIIIP